MSSNRFFAAAAASMMMLAGLVTSVPAMASDYLQCVPFARAESGVDIRGNAKTWWAQAADQYERGDEPREGAVMAFAGTRGMPMGHVAVVKKVVSDREIRIDHANWLNDGSVYINNPVVDVSAANDWSAVRVFNLQTGTWGGRTYPVRGFIGAGSESVPAPQQEPIDALIANLAASSPVAARPAKVQPASVQPASAGADDRNPPAHSPFALTADDLAIE